MFHEFAAIIHIPLAIGMGILFGAIWAAIPGVASLLRNSGVGHPPLASALNYTARLRTEAVLRRGFYRVVSGFKKVLKRPVQTGEEDTRALQEGLERIRRETLHSLIFPPVLKSMRSLQTRVITGRVVAKS